MTQDKVGPALNRRVGVLFERAGFVSKPNANSTAEHEVTLHNKKRPLDLYATEKALGITIIGSNKSGAVSGGFSAHLSDLKELGKIAKAGAIILVVTKHQVTREDRQAAEAAGVTVWEERDLLYYEALVEAVHSFAKYEIIHALGLETKEEKTIVNVLALRIRQPTEESEIELYMFALSADKLLKTCVVFRRANGNAEAYQRMVAKKRLPGIRAFVSKANAILPTNLVVSIDENKITVIELEKTTAARNLTSKPLTLSSSHHEIVALGIPMAYASMELLDGQHRLFGFAVAEPATRQAFNLAVVAIKGLQQKQKQTTFVAINDNSRRMDPNLVAYLQYEKDDALCQKDNKLMAIRVAVDINSRSPFLNKVRLLDMGKQTMTLKGLSGYDLKGLVGPRGALRVAFPTNLPSDYVTYLSTYFSLIRTTFKSEWDDPKQYILSTNRGIAALLKLLKSILKTINQDPDPQLTLKYIKALKGFNWEYSALKQKYVGSQGWKGFHTDLVQQIRKKYPRFQS